MIIMDQWKVSEGFVTERWTFALCTRISSSSFETNFMIAQKEHGGEWRRRAQYASERLQLGYWGNLKQSWIDKEDFVHRMLMPGEEPVDEYKEVPGYGAF